MKDLIYALRLLPVCHFYNRVLYYSRYSAEVSLSNPLLIVVSGLPCGGKTTIGRAVARKFYLPFFSKDDIKESLFNNLGWSDRAWSKKLGIGSEVLLFESVGKVLEAGVSVIAENAFWPEFDVPRFQELSRKYSYKTLQIHCTADNDLLVSRFFTRAASPDRHPGHAELANREEFERHLESGVWKPLAIGGQVIEITLGPFGKRLEVQGVLDHLGHFNVHVDVVVVITVGILVLQGDLGRELGEVGETDGYVLGP